MTSAVLPLPTDIDAESLEAQLTARAHRWFYRFEFSNGVVTPSDDELSLAIHQSRAEIILPMLDDRYAGRWDEVACVDVGCHQGWFAFQLKARGARLVRGFDVRPEHVEAANTIAGLTALPQPVFQVADVTELGTVEPADIVLMLGLLYHLEDPMEALRIARRLTRDVCVLESELAVDSGEMAAGFSGRRGPAVAVVPRDPTHASSHAALALVPTWRALETMALAAGFGHVEQAAASPSVHETYRSGGRAVAYAYPRAQSLPALR